MSQIITPAAPPPLVVPNVGTDISKYITNYVKLRAAIKTIKDRHATELEPYITMKEALEEGFKSHLLNTGTDSASCRGVGTVYTTAKKSATIADAAEFRRFVIGGEQWDLVDWRANAPQIETFITENAGVLPPGVNFSVRTEVGIRKA